MIFNCPQISLQKYCKNMQNQMSSQMFRKQMLSIPLHKGSFLSPLRAADVISKAFQMAKVGFEWVQVDKPVGN
jgi:hypothetical protein